MRATTLPVTEADKFYDDTEVVYFQMVLANFPTQKDWNDVVGFFSKYFSFVPDLVLVNHRSAKCSVYFIDEADYKAASKYVGNLGKVHQPDGYNPHLRIS